MPIITLAQAETFTLHGATFTAYARPTTGSDEICGWRLELDSGVPGTAHRVVRGEVIAVLRGDCHIELDGVANRVRAGDVVIVPAGTRIRVDGGEERCTAWVSAPVGFSATTDDGQPITPPWVR